MRYGVDLEHSRMPAHRERRTNIATCDSLSVRVRDYRNDGPLRVLDDSEAAHIGNITRWHHDFTAKFFRLIRPVIDIVDCHIAYPRRRHAFRRWWYRHDTPLPTGRAARCHNRVNEIRHRVLLRCPTEQLRIKLRRRSCVGG
jgi:hypothetical protein